ncbi:YT521-B-like family protein [Babesia bovis T2Bo]|uniref:YT521-B-like family protein n=1 Tax=Babesia bovis TaxID=5865 RepID=A7ANR0_BABBO|nr:YT521-B-like family protein [Babesia bovis T2Bo]EDO08194.1 YT521-B-like family protein [Babesia bovis T2Bo]|eukprot:XP_001611762.1 YT521-B-like family protein [Babesia bovis T2Bo]
MDLGEYSHKNVDHNKAKSIYEHGVNVYYIVKSFSDQNVRAALIHNVWATTPKNEVILDKAYQKGGNVILVFSINGSSRFIGYALMQSRPGHASFNESVFFMANGNKFNGKHFDILWIRVIDLPFTACAKLKNSLNEYKPVKLARDGQEIDKTTGKALCIIFEEHYTKCSDITLRDETSKTTGFTIPTGVPNTVGPGSPLIPGIINPQLFLGISQIGSIPTHIYQGMPTSMLQSPRTATSKPGKDTQYHFHITKEQALIAAEFNPAISIFPIDLTNMSYDQYISLYKVSLHHWENQQVQQIKEENDG